MPISQKIAEWFYGGHQPRDVALAVSLGVLTGALTGGNASWAIVLLAAIALNAHTRLFLCCWPCSALAAWLASNTLDTVGRFVLDGTALGRALARPGSDLLIPLLGWNQDSVIGGMVLGGMAAMMGGFISYRVTVRLNRRWYATPPRPPAGEATDPACPIRPIPPVLTCLWYGPSQRERTARRQAAPRRLRRGGVPSTLAASFLLAAACWSLASRQAERELERQLRAYSGGPVAAGGIDISLWTGRFTVRDLRFATREAAAHDRLQVKMAQGTLSAGMLLRGYVRVDQLSLEGVRIDEPHGGPRHGGGSVGQITKSPADAPRQNELVLSHRLRHWDRFCRQLGALERVVAVISRLPDMECRGERITPARTKDTATPRVEIRQARITDLENSRNLGHKALLEAKNLSSRPVLTGPPAELKLILPKFGAEIDIAFDATAAGKHTVRCSACNLDLPRLVEAPYVSRVVRFHAGHARLTGEGECDADRIKLRFAADVEALSADVSSDERLLGIEPETWQAGLARLGDFHTRLTLAGPWSRPELTLDRRDLVEGFQRQLQLAGAIDLLTEVGVQLASRERRREGPFVVQTSALDAQVTADPPGFCDFSEAVLPQIEDEPVTETSAVVERLPPAPIEEDAAAYPTTEFEPPASGPPAEASPPARAPSPEAAPSPPPERRPLPGPVHMAVGRDPSGAIVAAGIGARAAAAVPREGVLARLTRAWREKFSRPENGVPTQDEPTPPVAAEPMPARAPVSAAAGEAWYNRRWR